MILSPSFKGSFVQLALAIGLLTAGSLHATLVHGSEAPKLMPTTPSTQAVPVQVGSAPASSTAAFAVVQAVPAVQPSLPEDGVYLYGQSVKPNQIGKTYAVLEVKQGKVVGAFYMPSSSFDCFHGEFQTDKLALTVVDSYERTAHPYAIALEKSYPVAAAGGNPVANSLKLQGFHPISTLSETDQRILTTCKADYQQTLSR
ncbi:hypothetical protein BST81_14900 [Leptolyngbya sp. 'hensonii']|uniref:hypothetical protein n=1 Tax=Leptolyngbya sp. 'hensonii' TaxID=1922337 RepID=UPI00094FE46F|nr:hypothetical protein [Leptolyngbya sp. 'hensonii']OLP17611.1 hypothetical protein BST81_14900 [Leptolyngbya sp. 'hensonii']